MKLLKQLGAALTGLVLSVTPSIAATTADLLTLMDESGVTVVVNGPRCRDGIDGAYQWTGIARRMVICTDELVTENDHNTVRHETIHAIQHCKNAVLQRPYNTPLMEPNQVIHHAENILTRRQIQSILTNYPEEQWLVELEAFTGAEVLSAKELMTVFREWCLLDA